MGHENTTMNTESITPPDEYRTCKSSGFMKLLEFKEYTEFQGTLVCLELDTRDLTGSARLYIQAILMAKSSTPIPKTTSTLIASSMGITPNMSSDCPLLLSDSGPEGRLDVLELIQPEETASKGTTGTWLANLETNILQKEVCYVPISKQS